MKRVNYYETFDGWRFDHQTDALNHEFDLHAEKAYQKHRRKLVATKTYAELRKVVSEIHAQVDKAIDKAEQKEVDKAS